MIGPTLFFDIPTLIQTIGYIGVFILIFTESGLVFGVFFPGDSLLFVAGLLAAQGYLNFLVLVLGASAAAILGNMVGYAFGRRIGPRIFKHEHTVFFNQKNLLRTQSFYRTHGGKAIILARFLPVIRTFAPILAGVGLMDYPTFFIFTVFGALLWAFGLITLGYFLGSLIPNIDQYLLPIVLAIVALSFLPSLRHIWRNYRLRQTRPSGSQNLGQGV